MIQSAKRNVRALVFLAKSKGIQHVVFSPGSRNAPLVIGFANDPHFHCITVHDERSAGFVALGISQATSQPVIICCTSGSAAVNYYPAIVEAFYQKVPIVAVTADRPSEWMDQGDGQTIRQEHVFANHINYQCNLYKDVDDRELQVYNERVINEAINTAILEQGPVHINAPFKEPLYDTVENPSDQFKRIEQVHIKPEVKASWGELGEKWKNARKKVVLIGQHKQESGLQELLNHLNNDSGVLTFTESTSNVQIENSIGGIDKVINTINEEQKAELAADILITIDGAVVSKMVKALFRKYQPKEHWHVSTSIPNPDTYQSLTHSVVAEPKDFFRYLSELEKTNHNDFKKSWMDLYAERQARHKEYTALVKWGDFKAFHHILNSIRENAVLHIANSSPIRYAQLFEEGRKIPHYCNRGAAGIDGSSSTAVGYGIGSEKQVILISGDISFLYDSNAFFHNHVPDNFKAIVLNNGGGNIFRIIPGPATTNKLEEFFEAQHTAKIEGVANTYGLGYTKVMNEKELVQSLPDFMSPKSGKQILEIITDKEINPSQLKQYFKYLEHGET